LFRIGLCVCCQITNYSRHILVLDQRSQSPPTGRVRSVGRRCNKSLQDGKPSIEWLGAVAKRCSLPEKARDPSQDAHRAEFYISNSWRSSRSSVNQDLQFLTRGDLARISLRYTNQWDTEAISSGVRSNSPFPQAGVKKFSRSSKRGCVTCDGSHEEFVLCESLAGVAQIYKQA